MSYISLYRKWRPQTFAELVGQEHVARTLTNAIKSNRVAHAYLFAGPRGTGKTSTAKILAKAVNCVKGPTPAPCGECDSCRGIIDGSLLDVLEIDAASNRGIDEIRDLREKVHFGPTGGPKKVYIIDEVHMLTPEAFNALLKILEEPPNHVIFVLATTEPSKVPSTIVSRCQRFDFRRISFANLVDQLSKVAKAERIKVEDSALELIAKQAQGGLRDALGMLDQLASYTGKDVKAADVAGLLGLIGSEKLFQATDLIASGSAAEIFPFVHELVGEGRDIRQFTKEFIEHGRNLFVLQNGGTDEIINATSEEITRLKEQTKKLSLAQVSRLLDIFSQALLDMKTESEPQFILELAMLQLMRPEVHTSIDAILERLERLENQAVDRRKISEPASRQEYAPSSKPVEKIASAESFKDETPVDGLSDNTNLREIERLWPTIMAKIKQKSLSTHAILMECHPIGIEDGKFIIGIAKDWQQNLLGKAANNQVIKWALKHTLQADFKVVCRLNADKAANSDVVKGAKPILDPIEEVGEETAAQSGDVLNLIKENFGAEIVGETE